MAEPVGAAASVITLVQLAAQLCKLGSKIRGASHEWRRYYTSLENLGHAHMVIGEVIKTLNLPADLTVKLKGKEPESLVSFCDNRLNVVLQEGIQVLKKFNTTEEAAIKRLFKRLFKDTGKRFEFILAADRIRNLISSVEHEKSCLQLALSVAILAANGQEHQATQAKIAGLTERMLEKFHDLTTLHRENQFLRDKILVSMSDHTEPEQTPGLSGNLGDGPQPHEYLSSTDTSTSDGGSVENEDREEVETHEDEENLEDDQTHAENLGEGEPRLEVIGVRERHEGNELVKISGVTVSPNAIVKLLRDDEDLLFDESDLERFRDYLASQDETVSSELQILPQAQWVFTNQLFENLCRLGGNERYRYKFCIRAIVMDDDDNRFHFIEPCLQQPCDHVTIHTNVDVDMLENGDEFILRSVSRTDDSESDDSEDEDSGCDDSSLVTVESVETSQSEADKSETDDEIKIQVFDRCENGCSHTLLLDSEVSKCCSNGSFRYHFDYILKPKYPLSSHPCVFCVDEARRPYFNFTNKGGMWPFYSKKYEYLCRRCGKKTTVSG